MLKIGERKKMENSCTVNGQFTYSKSDNFMKRMHTTKFGNLFKMFRIFI